MLMFKLDENPTFAGKEYPGMVKALSLKAVRCKRAVATLCGML
jgi:hypothetical protein